jgi:hypothetical protein
MSRYIDRTDMIQKYLHIHAIPAQTDIPAHIRSVTHYLHCTAHTCIHTVHDHVASDIQPAEVGGAGTSSSPFLSTATTAAAAASEAEGGVGVPPPPAERKAVLA